MMDMSKLSDDELKAIASGDLSKVSTETLQLLAGGEQKPQKNAAEQAGAKSLRRGLFSAINGPTFGWGDEIFGGITGGIDTLVNGGNLADNYRYHRDYARGAASQFNSDNPKASLAIQAAVAAPAVLRVPGPFGNSLLGRTGNAATAGGVFGAVSGAGSSTADSGGGVAQDAAKGAAFGAATGGALQVAGAAIGAGANAVVPRIGDIQIRGSSVRDRLADAVDTGRFASVAEAIRNSGGRNYAREKVGEAFLRDATTPDSALSRAEAKLRQLGTEARVVDAGGQNVRSLLDVTANIPGHTKQAVEQAIRERQAGRASRMIGAAEDSLGTGGVRLAGQMDDWVAQQQAAASPLYERLHRIDFTPSQNLQSILSVAGKHGLTREAQTIADFARRPFSLTDDAINLSGRVRASDVDYVKRAMDDAIAKTRNVETGQLSAKGVELQNLKNELLREVDRSTMGLYKRARDAFAGPAALQDAAQAGRLFMQRDDASIRAAMSSMSQSERDAYALGAFEALRAKLGRQSGQTELMNLWKEAGTQEKLRAMFGNERAYREFALKVGGEARMKGLEQVGSRGSQTASRLFGADDLDVSPILSAATSGFSPTSLMNAAGSFWNKVKTPESVRDEIGSLLLSRNPQTFQEIAELTRRVNAARQAQAGLLGGSGGLLSGGLIH